MSICAMIFEKSGKKREHAECSLRLSKTIVGGNAFSLEEKVPRRGG